MELSFKVIYSEAIQVLLRSLQATAKHEGRLVEFGKALTSIHERLGADPLTFGEPIYSLPGAKLRVRHALVLPLMVYWGVHQEENVVFVQDFQLV